MSLGWSWRMRAPMPIPGGSAIPGKGHSTDQGMVWNHLGHLSTGGHPGSSTSARQDPGVMRVCQTAPSGWGKGPHWEQCPPKPLDKPKSSALTMPSAGVCGSHLPGGQRRGVPSGTKASHPGTPTTARLSRPRHWGSLGGARAEEPPKL